MRRHLLGILAILFILGATALWWGQGEHSLQWAGMGWQRGGLSGGLLAGLAGR